MNKLSELDRLTIELTTEAAEEMWMEKYPNALALYDTPAVVRLVETEMRLNGVFPDFVLNDFTPATLLRCLSETFIALLHRGALDQYQRMQPTAEAQEEIDRMAGVGAGIALVPVDEKKQARESQAAMFNECLSDYKGGMPNSDFRRKWLGVDETRRAIYERVAASGRI